MIDLKEIGKFTLQKIKLLDEDSSHSRALCAKLRRAIGKPPGGVPDIWEVTMQGAPDSWCSYDGQPSYAEWAVNTALTLYAMHRQGKAGSMHCENVSIASATAKLVGKDKSREEAIKRRFNSFATSTDFVELTHHARGIIQMLKAEGITMDYARFTTDIFIFQSQGGSDKVRLRWGEDYYRELDKNERKKDDEQ